MYINNVDDCQAEYKANYLAFNLRCLLFLPDKVSVRRENYRKSGGLREECA